MLWKSHVLVLLCLLLTNHVVSAQYHVISRDEVDAVAVQAANISSDSGNNSTFEDQSEGPFYSEQQGVGQRCGRRNTCGEGLTCSNDFSALRKRCFPDRACLEQVVNSFRLDLEVWKESILTAAYLDESDLVDAARDAQNPEEFQQSATYLDFLDAFNAQPPPHLTSLQEAANDCIPKAPSTEGTVVYMGLHIEVSALVDLAMSIFWALGDAPTPNDFIRGTFGAELGAGAEVSMLIGFAFTGTTQDILGGSVVTDLDAAVGVGIGTALVSNLNGLYSLEFTIGVGLGAGFGIGYGITAQCSESNQPTISPSMSPSVQPSSRPSSMPSSFPSVQPSDGPSSNPSSAPSALPSSIPSSMPSSFPSVQPSDGPSGNPSSAPSALPSSNPSSMPSALPSLMPSALPSLMPSADPSSNPAVHLLLYQAQTQAACQPSALPSLTPSREPSVLPSSGPSLSAQPSEVPSRLPSREPSALPSMNPSLSLQPSEVPSRMPSSLPSAMPSMNPSLSAQPSEVPSRMPSSLPSAMPSMNPSLSAQPSSIPSAMPSMNPSLSAQPSLIPSLSIKPSRTPSTSPSSIPSVSIKPSRSPKSGGILEICFTSLMPATSDVTVQTFVRGDLDLNDEFYEVFDQDGTSLGQNPSGSATQCSAAYTQDDFTVAQATFNTWVATGFVSFTLDASSTVSASIGSCTGQNDGFIILVYSTR
ncbi:expressed unknown protein [Seminavis robusta]|uniref:Circumsporozoite protein n=1 Tax=Seminavis robusta TaxID=568900 RepID=A0A9N8EE38_9STRA|nr:expressed unknown protein [Seminavis robusta]|eukprot:Sro808_g205390.1 n/a (701) ;mRNA; f:15235-17912